MADSERTGDSAEEHADIPQSYRELAEFGDKAERIKCSDWGNIVLIIAFRLISFLSLCPELDIGTS